MADLRCKICGIELDSFGGAECFLCELWALRKLGTTIEERLAAVVDGEMLRVALGRCSGRREPPVYRGR